MKNLTEATKLAEELLSKTLKEKSWAFSFHQREDGTLKTDILFANLEDEIALAITKARKEATMKERGRCLSVFNEFATRAELREEELLQVLNELDKRWRAAV